MLSDEKDTYAKSANCTVLKKWSIRDHALSLDKSQKVRILRSNKLILQNEFKSCWALRDFQCTLQMIRPWCRHRSLWSPTICLIFSIPECWKDCRISTEYLYYYNRTNLPAVGGVDFDMDRNVGHHLDSKIPCRDVGLMRIRWIYLCPSSLDISRTF